jgi:hypothetical protein
VVDRGACPSDRPNSSGASPPAAGDILRRHGLRLSGTHCGLGALGRLGVDSSHRPADISAVSQRPIDHRGAAAVMPGEGKVVPEEGLPGFQPVVRIVAYLRPHQAHPAHRRLQRPNVTLPSVCIKRQKKSTKKISTKASALSPPRDTKPLLPARRYRGLELGFHGIVVVARHHELPYPGDRNLSCRLYRPKLPAIRGDKRPVPQTREAGRERIGVGESV